MVALMVFGDHDLARMAMTLNVPVAAVVACTHGILGHLADALGTVSDTGMPTA